MANKRKFGLTDARDYAFSLEGHSFDGFTVVRNKQVDSSRWYAIYELVLSEDGTNRFWATKYEQGLTEMQDIEPFEDEGDEVLFTQVYPHEITVVRFLDDPVGSIK
jgi:hypothetical protein